jgi:hypothetical protein
VAAYCGHISLNETSGVLRHSLTRVLLAAGGVIAFVGYSYEYSHIPSPETSAGIKAITNHLLPVTSISQASAQQQAATSYNPSDSLLTPAPDAVAQWIAEAFDTDPAKRQAAIAAMANAQSEQVVPTLQKILITGEPGVDRPLALHSLRSLALQQGDIDGGIRDALRQAIYDGSDAAITHGAQATLEEVEKFFDHGIASPSR